MAKILVHLTCGPDFPSKAALAMLVAKTAHDAGHEVSVFLASDSVALLQPAVVENLVGLGTGPLKAHVGALCDAGVRFYVSGMSAKTRGLDISALPLKSVEAAMPDVLVRLAVEADRVLCY